MKILDRDGLHLAPDSISYARVFNHIEETTGIKVTRGSVHERIWASHDDFRRDVLTALVSNSAPANYFVVDEDRQLELADIVGDVQDREITRLTIIKVVSQWTLDEIAQSETYRQVQSAKAIATRFNDPAAAAAMQQLLEEQAQRRLLSRRGVFADLIAALGLRPRPSLGLTMDESSDLFFSTAWALISGAFLNAGAGCSHVLMELEGNFGGPDDGSAWRVFSVGAKGLLEFLFEVDPVASSAPIGTPSSADSKQAAAGSDETTEAPVPELALSPTPPKAPARDKPGRRTRGELKQLVLNAGVETLKNTGMNLKPESLSYAAVFAQVYADHGLVVNRASVHKRFWSSHTEFCMEVMALALQVDEASDPLLIADVYAVPPVLNEDGSTNRRQTAYDTLQVISNSVFRPMMESPAMRRRMLIKAAIPDQPDSAAKTELRDLVVDIELGMVGQHMKLLQETVLDLGFEVRPNHGLDHQTALQVMAILLHISSVGASFEQLAGGTADGLLLKLLRVDGTDAFDEWTSTAVMARAALDLLFRPVAG